MNPSERNKEPEFSCHGCAHEASDPCKMKNVHMASGELICCLCARNDNLNPTLMVTILSNNEALRNSGVQFPCDMYISMGYYRLLESFKK